MAEVTKLSDLDLTKQYTYADYLLWKFEERVELLRGFIREMSPAPSRRHQTILQNINKKLLNGIEKKTCNVYVAPFDVRLPIPSAKKNTTVVQPDICVVCDESKLDDYGCNGAPDLIVEILSPSNSKHDIDTKFGLYEEAGVQEYWLVEPEEKMVLVYTLQHGKYIGLRPYAVDQIVDSPLFPALKIAVNEVFDRV